MAFSFIYLETLNKTNKSHMQADVILMQVYQIEYESTDKMLFVKNAMHKVNDKIIMTPNLMWFKENPHTSMNLLNK